MSFIDMASGVAQVPGASRTEFESQLRAQNANNGEEPGFSGDAGIGFFEAVNDTFRIQAATNTLNQGLLQSEYDFNYRTFPSNLGADYQGHYMVININVPVRVSGDFTGLTPNSAFANQFDVLQQSSKVDALRFGNVSGQGQGQNNSLLNRIPRFTKRIKQSIALFMPTPMVYNSQNVYEDVSLSALAGNLGVWAARRGNAFAAGLRGQANALTQGANQRGIYGGNGSPIGTITSLVKTPINPSVEVLFANVLQRSFIFEFLMTPSSYEESLTLKEIIQTLRFHGAPEIGGNYTGGSIGAIVGNAAAAATWIPPAEFDLTFFFNGVENTNIPKINTCVLERIEVDYSPTGIYSTFSNGHPVAARLSLGFREVEPLHKQRILQGF